MGNLLQLFIRYGGLVTFVMVQAACLFLMVRTNTEKGEIYRYSWGLFSGNLMAKQQYALDYVGLQTRVDEQAKSNAALLQKIANIEAVQVPVRDTFTVIWFDSIANNDSLRRKFIRPSYGYTNARVIGNTIHNNNNWVIINRGQNDQIKPDMGVVTEKGLVGITRHIDRNVTAVMSLLHQKTMISAKLALGNSEPPSGSLYWKGGDPSVMTLRDIPKHFMALIKPGVAVVTSGYSDKFPPNLPIGVVEDVPTQNAENPYFLDVKVRLLQDMSTLKDVFIINNILKSETDSLLIKIRDGQ